jgi:hypothetical protein
MEHFLHLFVLGDFTKRGHRTNAHALPAILDAAQFLDVAQAHDARRRGETLLERGDEVGAAARISV